MKIFNSLFLQGLTQFRVRIRHSIIKKIIHNKNADIPNSYMQKIITKINCLVKFSII